MSAVTEALRNPRTRLQWAQWLVTNHPSIKAFIVDANSKRPLGGSSWYIRNTNDPDQLAEWFEMTPGANWGAWLGSEYVAIDLDVKHDTDGVNGIAAVDAICKANGVENWLLELATLMVDTPSGGYHIIFKTPFKCANKSVCGGDKVVHGSGGIFPSAGGAKLCHL